MLKFLSLRKRRLWHNLIIITYFFKSENKKKIGTLISRDRCPNKKKTSNKYNKSAKSRFCQFFDFSSINEGQTHKIAIKFVCCVVDLLQKCDRRIESVWNFVRLYRPVMQPRKKFLRSGVTSYLDTAKCQFFAFFHLEG